MAADFREQFQVTAPVWVDPERRAFQALQFNRGVVGTLLDPRVALNAARALSKGFMQGRTQGDNFQQGGVLVVQRGGAPVYFYASQVAGDMPPTPEVLAAAYAAASPAPA